MTIGTRSVLYGVHQFLIHPWFVAWAWFKLYGLRRVQIGFSGRRAVRWWWRPAGIGYEYASLWRPALWVAFFVHDLGYWGKPNMDGPEGETHPEFGARIVHALFGGCWYDFVLYHSRYLAKRDGRRYSPLCLPDKLAFPLTPRWLYLLLARATGEIREYMAKAAHMNETGGKYAHGNFTLDDEVAWHGDVCNYITRWVNEHRDGREDTWTKTKGGRVAATSSGVHQ